MYRITITARAKRELKQITKLQQRAVAAVLEELQENPFLGKPLLRELAGKYSYRVGLYRIIYTVNKRDKKVIVLTA